MFIVKLMDRHRGLNLFALPQPGQQINDGLAFRVAVPLRDLIAFEPIDSPVVGKKHQIIMRGGDKRVNDIILLFWSNAD